MHEKDETRKKGSTDSGLRSILTVTRGGTFLFFVFARCRSLAAAWRVLVAVVSSQRRIERKRAKCAWPVARPVLTRTLRTLDGQNMPSQKRMTTAVSQGQSLACQRRASQIKINTEQGLCYFMFKERKKGDESHSFVA